MQGSGAHASARGDQAPGRGSRQHRQRVVQCLRIDGSLLWVCGESGVTHLQRGQQWLVVAVQSYRLQIPIGGAHKKGEGVAAAARVFGGKELGVVGRRDGEAERRSLSEHAHVEDLHERVGPQLHIDWQTVSQSVTIAIQGVEESDKLGNNM